MTAIHTIGVTITTADVEDAGTSSLVLFGIGGIEFTIPGPADDRIKRGTTTAYSFDATRFGLTEGDLSIFPVYLRILPLGVHASDWAFQRAKVYINSSEEVRFSRSFDEPYWMYVEVVHLRRHGLPLGPGGFVVEDPLPS